MADQIVTIDAAARERLARHLYLEAAPESWRPTAELGWDRRDERINFDNWLAKADRYIDALAGKEG